MNWLNPFNKVTDLVSEAITDKDLRNQLDVELDKLQLEAKRMEVALREIELKTRTYKWVDALHKMGRQILALCNVAGGVFLLYIYPDMPIEKITAVMGMGAAPTALYTFMKGKGR